MKPRTRHIYSTATHILKNRSLRKVVSFALVSLCAFHTSAFAVCAAMPTVMVSGSGTDYTGLCNALSSAEIAISSANTDISTSTTAANSEISLIKQAAQYATQVEQVAQETVTAQNQVIQVEMLIKDLEENPLQVITPDTNKLLANQKRIEQLAADIEKNSSSVGANLMNNMAHPSTIGLGEGSRFALWSEARRAAAEESYAKVKNFITDEKDKNLNITQAIKNLAHAQGQTATAKAAANVQGQQLGMLADLKEILNQMLGAQAVENGAKLEAEIAAAAASDAITKTPPGSTLIFKEDRYKGPGTVSNKGF